MHPGEKAQIDRLIATMTLDEKIGQLNLLSAEQTASGPRVSEHCRAAVRAGRVGTLSHLWGREQTEAIQRVAVEETRLGIPLLLAADVIHGHRIIFPIPLAEAGAFDPDLWQRTAEAAAADASADGLNLTYAPMLDVARDPRWGRIAESPGEDSWVASRFAEAKTRGFQGDNLRAANRIAATAKHLAAYGAVTAGREYASVEISQHALYETYLPPFEAAVTAGIRAIMPAFTEIGGVPMSMNRSLLRDVVRAKWGFDGVMISDYNAITELMTHGVAEDMADAAALALRAGMDIDLMGGAYTRGLAQALERSLVSMDQIDAAVHRVLELKFALGLFADPYRRRNGSPSLEHTAARELAREAARRAIVLLQNRNDALPLPADARVALIGPLADAAGEMLGCWASSGYTEKNTISFLEGLRNAFPAGEITHTRGVDIDGEDTSGIAEAVALARSADHVVLCLGEAACMSGEATSRGHLGLPGRQRELAEAVLELGKPTIVLLTSGRPLTVPWLFAKADAVLATWFLGSEAGNAVGDVLSGRCNPTARLAVSWPVDVGQVPIFYAQRRTGRPADPALHDTSKYLDLPVEPQFPFGHGLSYTQFALSNLRAGTNEVAAGDSLSVSVDITNSGSVAGEETLFLFVHDPVASIARPVLELAAVERIKLAPGASGTMTFTVPPAAFSFVGTDLSPCTEPGAFDIYVGLSAAPASLLKTRVEIVSAPPTA